MVTDYSVHSLVTRRCTPIHSNPQNDLGTQGRITRKLMMRVRISMCGPHIEIGQQEGVCGDYRTVAGRVRGKAFFGPQRPVVRRYRRLARRYWLPFLTEI